VEGLENRELLSWSPYSQCAAPGVQVLQVSPGVTPGSNDLALYALGLDHQLYNIPRGGYGELLTSGAVVQVAASPQHFVDGVSDLFVIGLDSQVYVTSARAPGQWSPFTLWSAPGVQVLAISAGVTPGSNDLALYALGLDHQLYNIPRGGYGELLTPGYVVGLSASPQHFVDGVSDVFAVGLDSQTYVTSARAPGQWSGYSQWAAPGVQVLQVSAGVTPGSNELALYALGLDHQAYNIPQGGYGELLTPGAVVQVAAAPQLLVGGVASVFVVGLDSQTYVTFADTPAPSLSGPSNGDTSFASGTAPAGAGAWMYDHPAAASVGPQGFASGGLGGGSVGLGALEGSHQALEAADDYFAGLGAAGMMGSTDGLFR
jgi:hypothetical protein